MYYWLLEDGTLDRSVFGAKAPGMREQAMRAHQKMNPWWIRPLIYVAM